MLNENQKNLIFDINCFYQLESQKEKIVKGQPISMLLELSFVAMKENSEGKTIDWNEKIIELNEKLKNYGFSENWILSLKNCVHKQMEKGISPEEFRIKFLKPIDLLINILIAVVNNSDPSYSKEEITETVINDTFESNHWEGPVIQQINTIRELKTNLGLDIKFVDEFGKIFIRQK